MIAIIDYGAGNTASVANAVGDLDVEFKVTKSELQIWNADKIIFPGVGEASSAVRNLHLLNLFSFLRMMKKPMLGICLGMQLLAERSIEGDIACLGIIPGSTEKFDDSRITVPHMGWSRIEKTKESKLFRDISSGEYFYFAHSFYLPLGENTIASAEHDVRFTAALEKENFYGVQFHPEKSGEAGLQVLKNFIELC